MNSFIMPETIVWKLFELTLDDDACPPASAREMLDVQADLVVRPHQVKLPAWHGETVCHVSRKGEVDCRNVRLATPQHQMSEARVFKDLYENPGEDEVDGDPE
ncbi:hypothetical protein JOH51_002554 [Rhizobium leguminosarum]|nr:hypothetical protein [Rhizobium leguminosarum]